MRNGLDATAARRGERGAALIVVIISVLVAAFIALALVVVATSRSRSVESRRAMEGALAVAEAGLSRGLAEANLPANRTSKTWPPAGLVLNAAPANEVRDSVDPTRVLGRFAVSYIRGDGDGVDNDGDGMKDEVDEKRFVIIESLGYYGPMASSNPWKVKVKGITEKAVNLFNINSALAIDDLTPNVNISPSAAFNISGKDHDVLTTNPIAGADAISAVSSTGTFNAADTADLAAKVALGQVNGASPEVKTNIPDNMDFSAMVAWAKANAPAANRVSGEVAGTIPTAASPYGDWQITYHDSSQAISGNEKGAGIWVVNGDLDWSGTCQFQGILIVTGQLTIRGGGSGKLLMGAVLVGGSAIVDFTNNGTTDIRYSSEAVDRAQNAAARYTMMAWDTLPAE
jgi:hypothetical protein